MGFKRDIIQSAFDGVFYSKAPVDWLYAPDVGKDGEHYFEVHSPKGKIYRVAIERVA